MCVLTQYINYTRKLETVFKVEKHEILGKYDWSSGRAPQIESILQKKISETKVCSYFTEQFYYLESGTYKDAGRYCGLG